VAGGATEVTSGRPRWVFGGYCVPQKKGFLIPVRRRDRRTLLPLIENHIAQGSEIHSDEHGAYKCLRRLGWNHKTVKHKQNFVDPLTGAHTQGIESFWAGIKRQIRQVHGSQGDTRYERLHEAVYRHNYRFTKALKWKQRLELFATHVAALYRN